MAYTLPNRINNGDDLDATPVDGNFVYLTNSLNAYDGANIVDGTITDSALVNDPESIRNEIFGSFIASGLEMSPEKDWENLTGTFAEGVAYINGKRTAINGTVKEFTAQKDTYVDVDQNGNYSYQEVANEATEPEILINTTRIAKVVTDGLKVIEYEDKRNLNPLRKDEEEAGFEPVKTATYGKHLKTLWTGNATNTLDLIKFNYSPTVQNSFWVVRIDFTTGRSNGSIIFSRHFRVNLSNGTWSNSQSSVGTSSEGTAPTSPTLSLVNDGNNRKLRVTQTAAYARTIMDINVLYRSSNGSTTWEFI